MSTKTEVKSSGNSILDSRYYYATGRRKTSVARVRLYPGGKGNMLINDKLSTEYFSTKRQKEQAFSPLQLTGTDHELDVSVKVDGGGVISQAEAIRHGVAQALLEYNDGFRLPLKKAGFLTRDPRSKERMKPGLKKARKKGQFSKR